MLEEVTPTGSACVLCKMGVLEVCWVLGGQAHSPPDLPPGGVKGSNSATSPNHPGVWLHTVAVEQGLWLDQLMPHPWAWRARLRGLRACRDSGKAGSPRRELRFPGPGLLLGTTERTVAEKCTQPANTCRGGGRKPLKEELGSVSGEGDRGQQQQSRGLGKFFVR